MINYLLKHCYDFKVKRIIGKRIYLEDDDHRTFFVHGYDFQTDWDAASPQVALGLKCYVKDREVDGALRLEQSQLHMLQYLYPCIIRGEEKEYDFIVKELTKTKNGELIFIISDAFGLTHSYKPTDEQKSLLPGDEIKLTVTGIIKKEDNRCKLKFKRGKTEEVNVAPINEPNVSESADEPAIGEFGEESDIIEFKSTIVYPAKATRPDIDTQIQVIVKTVAGFMNAKGGKLLIGVNDNGVPVGIESEYSMLNSSTKDKHTYKDNKDHYQLKIRSAIRYYLSPVAEDYIDINFSEHNGHTVCSIEVKPSKSVIWFAEREAYKRLGNSTIHLCSSAIEKLVIDKLNALDKKDKNDAETKRHEGYFAKPMKIVDEDDAVQETTDEEYDTIDESATEKQAAPATLKPIGQVKSGRGSFYMNMFTNGQWSWTKNIPTDSDLEFCIPINSPTRMNSLVMVYEDGCVNRVDANKLHSSKKEGKRYENGRRNDGVKLVKAFSALDNDMIACFCKEDGHERVKVHMVGHVSKHETMHLKGNVVINKKSNVTDVDICFVSCIHLQRVSALLKTENQKSNELGYRMDVAKNYSLLQVRETLKSVCDIVAE